MTDHTTKIRGLIKRDLKVNKDSIDLSYKSDNRNIEVRISPYFGSNIYQFKYNGKDIFYCDYTLLKERDWTGCFILWPLPNRVRDKQFEFEGKTYSLKGIKRKKGNYPLIHGLVDDQIWQIGNIRKNETSIQASTYIDIQKNTQLYKYFPFESRLTLTFILSEVGLMVEYTVENRSTQNMPFGFALHPYFSLLSGAKNTNIFLPANSVMEADEELLPTGKLIDIQTTEYNLNTPLPVSRLSLDHVFRDLDRSQIPYIDYTDQKLKVYLESSEDFTHMVLYTMEENFVCFENQTGSTDMINLYAKGVKENNKKLQESAHLLILPSGKKHTGFVRYRIEEY